MDNLFEQDQQDNVFNEEQEVELEQAPTPPVSPPKRHGLDNAKDALAMYKEATEKAIRGLYEHDPLIRDGINAQRAMEQMTAGLTKPKVSNVTYDAQGNLNGVSKSVVSGPSATTRNQTDLWKALTMDMNKKLGIKENGQ